MEEVGNRVKEGIVEKFDQIYGIIATENGTKYEFIDRDIEGEKIREGDHVSFFAETKIVKFNMNQEDNGQIEYKMARYVKKKNR